MDSSVDDEKEFQWHGKEVSRTLLSFHKSGIKATERE
jgi:hypothetical protein